ncbi:MAG: 23S rRNA (uracil(1939)-C(5))-methyltransferase RlmD [Patescibacteria group bacterium]
MAIQYQRGQKIVLELEKIVAGGVAMGRLPDWRPVFVKGGAPKEQAEVRLTRIKKDFVEAQFLAALRPSPDRVEAPFPEPALGGANWHYLSYTAQLAAKGSILKETLQKIGQLTQPEIQAIVPSPTEWRYRNKIELTFGVNERGKPALGFHIPGRFDEILPTDDVALFPEIIQSIISTICDWANRENLTVYDPRKKQGLLRNLVVRRAEHGSDLVLNLITAPGTIPEDSLLLALNSLPITGLVWSQNDSQATIVRVDQLKVLAGSPRITETFLGQKISYDVDSFFQTHTTMAERLATVLFERLASHTTSGIQPLGLNTRGLQNQLVIDGYAGVGGFGLFVAAAGIPVISIESHPASSADAIKNAEQFGVADRMTFINQTMESYLVEAKNLQPKNLRTSLIIDPPRAGLHPKALQAIQDSPLREVFYVSCNPATLARDLSFFTSHSSPFTPIFIQPFDLFPQTPHLETLVELKRSKM